MVILFDVGVITSGVNGFCKSRLTFALLFLQKHKAVGTTKLLLETVHVYRLANTLDFTKKTCPVGDLTYIVICKLY
jgi:hypothetical protein